MIIHIPTSIKEMREKKVTLESLKAENEKLKADNELLKGCVMELAAEVFKEATV